METTWPEWLKEFMVGRDLNQKGLAKLLGVSPSTVGNWIEGEKPKSEMIIRLAALAEADPADLFVIVNGLFVLRDDKSAAGSGDGDDAPDLERYRTILQEMEYLSDAGLELLRAQIRHVLRDRFPRAEYKAHRREGGGDKDASTEGEQGQESAADRANSG